MAVISGAATLLILLGAFTWITRFGLALSATAVAFYVLAGTVLIARVQTHHPFSHFGPGNLVTLLRLVLTCLFAGAAVGIGRSDLALPAAVSWVLVGLAVVTLVLDGVDGAVARRSGTASRFGARFDIEVDGLLLLSLAALALMLGKAGPWVLLIGALHYLFVTAGMMWPAFRTPLPPSWRRKAVCVVQGVVLAAMLAPVVVPPTSRLLAVGALALLVYSFAADLHWLARQGPRVTPQLVGKG